MYEVFKHLATRLSVFLFLGIQLDDPLFEEVSQLITTHWRGDWDGKCVRQCRGRLECSGVVHVVEIDCETRYDVKAFMLSLVTVQIFMA